MRRLVLVLLLILLPCVSAARYQRTPADAALFRDVRAKIDRMRETEEKTRITYIIARLQEAQEKLADDEQAVYILNYFERYLFAKKEAEELRQQLEVDMVTTPTPEQPVMYGVGNKEEFYDLLESYVNSEGMPERCVTYYDEIDQVAQLYNFPTPLIIATWWREHSCFLSNPNNEQGAFQITSHTYTPGDITIAEFKDQIEHFIVFSRAKWDYYDLIQKFDSIPIALSYNQYDLRALQKHSVMYNGAYSGVTPGNSIYANENFGTGPDGRDGIVAMFVKVLGWELGK